MDEFTKMCEQVEEAQLLRMIKSGLADNSYLDDGTGFAHVYKITPNQSQKRRKFKKAMSSEYDDTKLNLFSQDMTHNPEDSDDGLDRSGFDQFQYMTTQQPRLGQHV